MASPPPDIRDVSPKDLQKGQFKGAGSETFRVALAESPYNDIVKHGLEHSGVEVCGVLVGRVLQDEGGPFLEIEATIRGEHAASQGAQVTFTHETWNHIHNEMDKRFPERKIVGWYHTHPGFGIFLSEYDLFIHQSFFNAPFQVAFVFDPRSGDEGFFCWKEGKTARLAHFWVGRQMHCCRPAFEEVRHPPSHAAESATKGPRKGAPPGGAGDAAAQAGSASQDSDRLTAPPLTSLMMPLLLVLCGLTAGLFIGTIQGRRESDALITTALQRQAREMVYTQIMHIGLSQEMKAIEQVLADATGVIEAGEKKASTPGSVPTATVREELTKVREHVIAMREKYEILDRLITESLSAGAASLDELNGEVRQLRGQMLDVRRTVADMWIKSARSTLDRALQPGEKDAEHLRESARDMYHRALALTPEDQDVIDRFLPEIADSKKNPVDPAHEPEQK